MNLAKTLLAAALLAGATAQAQTADEIVKKHIEAIGGADAWSKVTSLKTTGSITIQGNPVDLILTQMEGKGMRQDINIMGMNNYIIVTPTGGWSFFPIQQQTEATELPADAVKAAQDEISTQEEFLVYKTKGYKVAFAGKEKLDDGKEYYKMTATSKDGDVTTNYIDPATYYTYRTVEKQKDQSGAEAEVSKTFTNYQKLPEGIVVPMMVTSTGDMGGDFTIKTVEVNTVKDDSIFKPSK